MFDIIPTCLFTTQCNNWYFGVLAGLNFSLGGVNVITVGALNTGEGCSSISDGAGNTLFYTDGVNVWNKSHALMPNGDSLMGGPSSTQSALIVPMPGSNSLYYILLLIRMADQMDFAIRW